MKKVIGVGLLAAFGFLFGIGVAQNQARAEQKDHKIGICHGTASDKNPYVYITVDISALKGHLDGTAPGHGKNNHPDFISTDGTCNIPSGPGPS
jgi:hypothetical protein